MTMIETQTQLTLDPEEKQKRIDRLMECTKEELATQWVMLGSEMKEKYDKLKMEFIEYKIANDISRFFEDVRSEQSNEVLGSKIRTAIQGNILYIDWLKKQEKSNSKKNSSKSKNK
jgi:TRAP-type C4-dicarboxylate transport system substrate-binding protein